MVTTESQRKASANWKKTHREQYNAAQAKRAYNRYQNDEEFREKKKERERFYQKERYHRKKAEALAAQETQETANVLLAMAGSES